MSALDDAQKLNQLNQELKEFVRAGSDTRDREKSARRIKLCLDGLARNLGLGTGAVNMFGSFSNGFKTGTSDLDVLLAGNVHNESAISILQRFAANLESMDLGFTNITKIFQASVPLLKLTDKDSEMEVDFCVGNELGLRNSFLLNTYCKYDMRALELGRLVKEWAKKHELVGTTDGCLNSYAYMLLVVFYLQSLQPPVVPNLQLMECESYLVNDRKWGGEDMWETKFFTDVDSLPKSQNTMTIGELLPGFFHFYTRDFDWRHHAVCIRKQEPGKHVDKYSLLLLPTNEDQWYVEDPFDLKHNLAGKCSRAGKKRIMDEMANALSVLQKQGVWSKCLPAKPSSDFYMKCRISQSVTPPDILEAFEEFDLVKLHFPKSETSRMPQAFLQFGDASSRRRAHTKNETQPGEQLHKTYKGLEDIHLPLFREVQKRIKAQKVLYPGCHWHLQASLVFPDVTYVDFNGKVGPFFEDPAVLAWVDTHKAYKCKAKIEFLHRDFQKLEIPPPDLLISMSAGIVSKPCGHLLRKGGHFLASDAHFDARLAHLDARFELVGVYDMEKQKLLMDDKTLGSCFVTTKGEKITAEQVRTSMTKPKGRRGFTLQREDMFYLFKRR
ncbi:unnamed protein product [Effrenium voratum]|nr:unnamed protein product [Effrenium voratum]